MEQDLLHSLIHNSMLLCLGKTEGQNYVQKIIYANVRQVEMRILFTVDKTAFVIGKGD